jgi:hypothetical protein
MKHAIFQSRDPIGLSSVPAPFLMHGSTCVMALNKPSAGHSVSVRLLV